MLNSIEHYDQSKHGQIIESVPRTGLIILFIGFALLIPPIFFIVNASRPDGIFRYDGYISLSTWLYQIGMIVGVALFACLMFWIFIRNRLRVKNFSRDMEIAYENGKVTIGKILSVHYRKTGQSHRTITGYIFRYEFVDGDMKTRKGRAYIDNATGIDFGDINLMQGLNITVLFNDKLSFVLTFAQKEKE